MVEEGGPGSLWCRGVRRTRAGEGGGCTTKADPKQRSTNPQNAVRGTCTVSLLSPNPTFFALMDDRPHKAHRPSQSGQKADKKDRGKGKEKQHGFNEKVRYRANHPLHSLICTRHLHRSRVGGRTVKDDGM